MPTPTAHVVYDHLYADNSIIEVSCWAHLRRFVFKALESDPDRAKKGLTMLSTLFRIERAIADAPRKKREAMRDRQSRPIVEQFFEWCETERDNVLDESPMSHAIRYALNQRVSLKRFLEDGRLPLSNNISELSLRREVCGRRNWLFVGSEDGAKANTAFVSLLASCRLHAIEPLGYLRDLFILLPSWPRHRVLELAPAYWHLAQDARAARSSAKAGRQCLPAHHARSVFGPLKVVRSSLPGTTTTSRRRQYGGDRTDTTGLRFVRGKSRLNAQKLTSCSSGKWRRRSDACGRARRGR